MHSLVHTPAHTAMHLRIDGISKSFGARRVLTDVSSTVAAGDRVGLIGENGSGKSTLLRIVAGAEQADRGTTHAVMPGGGSARIGLLHQEPPFAPDDTILQAVETAVQPVRAALDELERAAAALARATERSAENLTAATITYAESLEHIDRVGGWEIDTRIETVLAGVGIADLARDRHTRSLSGGQRARLSLAWLLLNAPDVLLLDEPTNHLDDDATEFVARALVTWGGPVLFASHDRAFLDDIATSLIDLDPAPQLHSLTRELVGDGIGSGIGVRRFTGNYSDYLSERDRVRRRWEQQYRDEQAELSKLRAAAKANHTVGHSDWKPRTESRIAKKFYGDRNARVVSRRVNDFAARVEAREAAQVSTPPEVLEFSGIEASVRASHAVASDTGPALVATGVSVDRRLAATDFSVSFGEKWLVTGPNGAGKSTLLRILAGREIPDTGQVQQPTGARVGLLGQEVDFPDPDGRGMSRTVQEAFRDGVGATVADTTPLSALGLFAQRDLQQPLEALSVGQRQRLALAIVLADPPEILILDEPTNHLSLALAETLESALREYPGVVILASHDRWLRQRWTDNSLEIVPYSDV